MDNCHYPRNTGRVTEPSLPTDGRPAWFEAFLADRGTRKPSAHTMKAYRQDFDAIATLIVGEHEPVTGALTMSRTTFLSVAPEPTSNMLSRRLFGAAPGAPIDSRFPAANPPLSSHRASRRRSSAQRFERQFQRARRTPTTLLLRFTHRESVRTNRCECGHLDHHLSIGSENTLPSGSRIDRPTDRTW
jgi:hypothetical protein